VTRPFSDLESGFCRSWCQRGGHWSRHGAGGPHSALPIRSAASRPRAGMTWLYVSVVVRICAWPSTSMTTRGCTPSDSSSLAAVCRPSWRRTSRTPASCSRAFHACQSDFRSVGRPLACANQQAWSIQVSPGAGRALNAALGLAVLVLGLSLLYVARTLVGSLQAADVLVVPMSFLSSFLLWTSVPWLLLERRIAWRRFILAGALTAVCATAYGVASTVYMPRQLASYSERYGLFGVTLALIGWLLGMALIVVAATAVAAELDRAPEPWVRWIRRAIGVEPVLVAAVPGEEMLRTGPALSSSSSVSPPSGTSPRRWAGGKGLHTGRVRRRSDGWATVGATRGLIVG